MINLLTEREQVIHFFIKHTNNRLNKNCYNVNFYKNRQAEHVFNILNHYFDSVPVLSDASLAQKYYHIFHYNADIPHDEKFINFVEGYSGVKHIKQDMPTDFFKAIPQKMLYNVSDTVRLMKENLFDRSGSLVPFINDYGKISNKILIASIFRHTGDSELTLKHRMHILLGNYDERECYCPTCNKLKKIFQFKMFDHCGKKLCIKKMVSEGCKERESYRSFLSESARQKKSAALKGRKFTEEHKQKIRDAKKEQWTDEYKRSDKQMRIDKGVYTKASVTLKRKIMSGEYTPVNNRGRATRIVCEKTGISYRSTWEYKFHQKHPHMLFEHTRISYTLKEQQHIYIIDFTDVENRVVYEIKPKSLLSDEITIVKAEAAKQWGMQNGYTYKIVTEDDFNFYEHTTKI